MQQYFKASTWLQSHLLEKPLPFQRVSHPFIHNWKGETLPNTEMSHLYQFLKMIQKDIISQLSLNPALNSRIKKDIFIHYQRQQKDIGQIDEQSFWEILSSSSEHHKFNFFLQIYSFQLALLFFLKQKALTQMAHKRNFKIHDAYYANLNTFYSKLFPLGSSHEVSLRAFTPSLYTWYQPNTSLFQKLKDLAQLSFSQHSALQLMNVVLLKASPIYQSSLQGLKNLFSHLLSSSSPQNASPFKAIYLTKEKNLHSFFALSETTCLPIYSQSFEDFILSETYINQLSEMVFLNNFSSRPNISPKELHNLISFLNSTKSPQSPLLGAKFLNTKKENIFYDASQNQEQIYSHILQLTKGLQSKGHLYIFSPKCLFPPSSKEKTKQLLKQMELISHISFSELKGHDHLPAHIYILKNTPPAKKKHQSHFHFKFHGQLDHNGQIDYIFQLFQHFYKRSEKKLPMIFSHKLNHDKVGLDFFQDIILDGIVMSSSHNSEQLTHPQFFQGIHQNCLPLENFFKTPPIQRKKIQTTPLLSDSSHTPELVLVVKLNSHNHFSRSIQIIPGTSYLGYRQEHGDIENQYFALIPKQYGLNISLLRYFFNSSIGQQIVDLCFTGNSHYRTKIKTLLIPSFFSNLEKLPSQVKQGISFLETPVNELKNLSPQKVYAHVKKIEPYLNELFSRYPLTILSLLYGFQEKLETLLSQNDIANNNYIDFYQEQLITELKNLKSSPILPKHQDIYVDLHVPSEDLSKTIDTYKNISEVHKESYRIDLYHKQTLMASIYLTKNLSYFVNFLLKQMTGFPLDSLLKSLSLPTEQDLAVILPSYTLDYSLLKELKLSCLSLIENYFKKYIMS